MLSGLEIKKELYNNPKLIEKVLESIGCEFIKNNGNNITSTRPGGKNKQSIYIRLTELLSSKCFTRQSEFESKYEIRDFLELMQFLMEDIKIVEVIKYISNICGFDSNGKIEIKKQVSSMSFLKGYKQATREDVVNTNVIIPEDSLEDFMYYPSYHFFKDNISIHIQEEFGVCYDIVNDRVCFPIRDGNGNLVSIKGRTLKEDFKLKGIPKYMYYEECNAGELLYGEYENREYINKSDEIIVVESEKTVMALASYGYRNAVATSKKTITKQQLLRLFKMGKSITLAYDNDVTDIEIQIELNKFKGLLSTNYIKDLDGMLGEKDSPTDKGFAVWEILYRNKIKSKR